MIRAVIDTNITVSALLFGGLPLTIVKAALAKKFTWVTSPFLIEESERVLSSNKFGLTSNEIKTLTLPIFSVAEIVIPQQSINIIPRCPADNHVLECAVEGKSNFIVTGDRRDLLVLEQFKGIGIITARKFLNQMA
ncbi:MAG: putative toxin-antitoxin system toxin component, PIN family [Pseudobdellovibrionaceae bacterium]